MVKDVEKPESEKTISETPKPQKKKRRNKSYRGPDFIAPDGGWAWMVCLAVGISNFSVFPVYQNFGLLFRTKLTTIGLKNSQITTLININSALSSITGLFNGPLFRRFSFRQVALTGSLLVTIGLILSAFGNSFMEYICCFSILYGVGSGFNLSANTLVLNTYFKNKRRVATGIAWALTASGPIVLPYLVTYLLPRYGIMGTIMTFSGIGLHAFAAALIYQPVEWHVKNPPRSDSPERYIDKKDCCDFCKKKKFKNSVETMNGHVKTGKATLEVSQTSDVKISDDTHVISPINKQGSKTSLVADSDVKYELLNEVESSKHEKPEVSEETDRLLKFGSPNTENHENEVREVLAKNSRSDVRCTCLYESEKPPKENVENPATPDDIPKTKQKCRLLRILERIWMFFEFDLLKDYTYVILMLGLTIANFSESNFSILTPFILDDFGLTDKQIATFMSITGILDTIVRFAGPFAAEKIGWDNKTFYLIGVCGMAFGRVIIAHFRSYTAILLAAAWIGMNKGLRSVFMALVLPSHVSLERLPAASGLQLLTAGMFAFCFGPVVGAIRDATNYVVTLHCLNIGTFLTAIAWTLADFCKSKKDKLDNN